MEQKSWYDLFDEAFFKVNFEGIRQYMKLVNWQWCGRGIPTVQDLKGQVSSLFHSAMRDMDGKSGTRIRSGGFSVCFFTWPSGTRCVEIYFDISQEKKTISQALGEQLSA